VVEVCVGGATTDYEFVSPFGAVLLVLLGGPTFAEPRERRG